MSIFDRVFGKKPEERQTDIVYGPIDGHAGKRLSEFRLGGSKYDKGHPDQIATVYSCCKILSDYLARIPIEVLQTMPDGSDKVLVNDYRYELLQFNPNGYQNHFKFWNAVDYVKNLRGNSYIEIKRIGGRASSFEIIPSYMFINHTKVRGILYYGFYRSKDDARTGNKQKIRVVNSANIIHPTNVTDDGITGISPIRAMDMMYSVNWSGWNTLKGTYDRGLQSGKAITYPLMVPGEKGQTEARQQFENEYMGAANAGKLVALPKGAELIDTQISPKDAQFISTIEFTTKQIASAFRVPAHMLNILEQTKFASVQEMQRSFLNDELGSTLKMYEDELSFKLLSLEERKNGMKIKFNTDALLSLDTKSRTEVQTKQITGGIKTVNEIRLKEGLQAIENGDKNWMPSNYVFIQERQPPEVKE